MYGRKLRPWPSFETSARTLLAPTRYSFRMQGWGRSSPQGDITHAARASPRLPRCARRRAASDVRAPEERERVVDRIREARHAADIRALADALGAERMMRRGRGGEVDLPMRRFDRGRQEIVHQRRGQHVAFLVVVDLLAHRDAERLGQPAVDLALDDHRVDARAAIVERVEAPHLGLAGVDVDVDHADIGAEREGEVRRIVVIDRLEPRLHAGRHLVIGRPGELGHGLEPLRIALHLEAVDVPFEIVVVHFEHVGGDHLRLGLDLAAGHRGRGARDRRRARAVGAETVGRRVGVAVLDLDVVGRDARARSR